MENMLTADLKGKLSSNELYSQEIRTSWAVRSRRYQMRLI